VDPVDDFTRETTVALQDFAPNENWHAGIVVRFADFDALLFGPFRGTSLRLERTGSGNLASLTNSSTTMDLRVVRSGQDYSFEFREDASQPWQVVTVYSASETPTHAGLVAKTWDPNVGLVMDVNRLGLNELPPVAVAGADELTGQAPHTVQFTSTSFDPDGPYLTHAWDFGGGGASTESDPSFEFATPGTYDVVLTVTDGAGYADADTLSILVEGNLPPAAEITAPLDGLQFVNDGISPISLTGLGSDPDDVPDSLVLTWSVDLNDGGAVTSGYATPPAGASSSFVPDVVDAGQGVSWDVILTVTDTEGLAASDTVTIFDATLPPLALLDLRASLADSLGPPVVPGAQSPWVNLGSAGSAAAATLLNFGGATGWAGTGGVGDPWRLEFDGVDDVVTLPGGTLAGLDQGASIEMWVRFPADVQARSYLVEWLEDTAAPFPGMSLAVENGQLRIFLGTWVDLAPVQPNRWSRLLATKEPGAWLVELDGVVIGQGSTANLGAQVTELVLGAGTFAGAGVYAEHAGIAVSELRVWDFALSEVNRTVLGALDHSAWTNPPRLNLVTPSTVDNDSIQTLNLSGLDFVDGAMAQLIQSGIDTLEAESVVFMDAANLSAQFDFSNLTAGPRDVRVVNPDGQSSLLASAIQVNAPSPAIMAFLAALPDGASPPNVPSVDGPWLSTLGPDTLEFAGLEVSASGWRGDGSVEDPWQLALDGIDDLLTLRGPGIDSLDAASEFSAEFWLKVDGADSTGTLLAWREPLVELRLELTRDGLGLLDGGVFNLMSELPRDRWTYLVLTTSPDSTRLWIDGVETGGAPGAGFSLAPPIIEVGENLHSNFSSIRFSTVVLSANQIVSEYSSESGSYPSPEAARLRLVASAGHVADGDTITVDLDYDDLGYSFGLRGVSVSVLYDPALLDFVEASEGEFLGGAGTTFFTMDSSTPGIVAFDTSLLGQSEGAMGAGTLARLRFAEIVVETDTATTISVALQELIDADDPPNPIPTLKLPSIDLLIHGGTIVASPKVASLTRLYGAAPNPFNPRTTIAFDLASGGRTRLAIYDLAGRLVRVLVDQPLGPGPHEFVWDGTDHGGRRVASGVYLYALRPEGTEPLVRKMTLVK
jgi:PKD repeat protein